MRSKKEQNFQIITNFLEVYKEAGNGVPTVREIADGVGMARATVARYLSVMREAGVIEFSGHRNISLKKEGFENKQFINVPILGTVACGLPKLAEENIEEYVCLPVSIFGRGDFFILHASGDSMVEANIADNDLVLVKQQNYAFNGQIVVALIGTEATLKRYYPEPEKNRIRLQPANKAMRPIYVTHCEIQGVAVKVFKDL